MTTTLAWNDQELAAVDAHDVVHVASVRLDGTMSGGRIVWAVRLGDAVYVRSVNGSSAAWYLGTRHRHEGTLEIAGSAKDVAFIDVSAADPVEDRIDAAYRAKYSGYPESVERITADQARASTLKLVPR